MLGIRQSACQDASRGWWGEVWFGVRGGGLGRGDEMEMEERSEELGLENSPWSSIDIFKGGFIGDNTRGGSANGI